MHQTRGQHTFSSRVPIAATAVVALAVSLTVVPAGPSVANTVSAQDLPGFLTQQSDLQAATYNRDFFQHWIDADGDGCDTRREVLIEESVTPVTVGSGCSISGGQWLSSYDNATWSDAADVDIDHVVPLAEAWRSGAWGWTSSQRRDFANDLQVAYALVAVTDNVNQSKGDRDPAQWMPPYAPYHCQYLIDWALVKYRYSLTVDVAELTKLSTNLSGACGATSVTLPAKVITQPTPLPNSDVVFPSGVTRLAGESRYDTALQVAQRYPSGVPAAFVATGTNFPDALSGAAAAAMLGGPLLLTTPTALPSSVAAELVRLRPSVIYVLGGTGAVSSAVETALQAIAPVQRFGGASRYDTGLQVVDNVFTSATYAVLATGRNFPDALAATGAAGKLQAPVILVDGSLASVPASVLSTLGRLGVTNVVIAGGTGAVSSGIQTQLSGRGFTVERFGGADRYATTAAINNRFFPRGSTDTLFLATGANFPDALAGAALAGLVGSPMFVTAAACVPTPVYQARNALLASKTVVLGGTSVVSNNAAQNNECVAPAPPPQPGPPSNPGDSKNCSDFSTWSQAQAWFNKYYPYYGDIARLDADNDRIACESLPGAP